MSTQSWLLRNDGDSVAAVTPPGSEYHRAYAGEKRRVARGVVAIVLLFAGLVGFGQLFVSVAAVIDEQVFDRTSGSPLQHAAGSLSLAVLIPYSMLLQRVLYGVPGRSLHSVTGRFRFSVFGRALLAFGPLVLLVVSVGFVGPADTIPWTTIDLVAVFAVGMLLTPLAAAGEEYGFRGLMFRVVGGWTRGARSGAVVGVIVTTVLFSLIHGTLDPYLLASYLILFSTMAIVTWRTGGLEVAIVLHGIYNLTALVLGTTLHLDLFGALAGRGQAVGSIGSLLPGVGLIVITAVIWWLTRQGGPVQTPQHTSPHRVSLPGSEPAPQRPRTLHSPRSPSRGGRHDASKH